MRTTYYKNQLDRLNKKTPLSVKFYDGIGNTTNQLNISEESIDNIIKFLQDFKSGK